MESQRSSYLGVGPWSSSPAPLDALQRPIMDVDDSVTDPQPVVEPRPVTEAPPTDVEPSPVTKAVLSSLPTLLVDDVPESPAVTPSSDLGGSPTQSLSCCPRASSFLPIFFGGPDQGCSDSSARCLHASRSALPSVSHA